MGDEPASEIVVFTDGSCLGNPGPGGWCAILRARGREKVLSGGDPATTNNRMELRGALEALRALKRPCAVVLMSDSQYLVRGMTDWVRSWRARGWRRAGDKPVENLDLWKDLVEAAGRHSVRWVWIRGHAGHPENERCDRIAKEEIRRAGGEGKGGSAAPHGAC